jgi:hypothetical protein
MPVVDRVKRAGVFRRGGFLAEVGGFATFVSGFGGHLPLKLDRCWKRCLTADDADGHRSKRVDFDLSERSPRQFVT